MSLYGLKLKVEPTVKYEIKEEPIDEAHVEVDANCVVKFDDKIPIKEEPRINENVIPSMRTVISHLVARNERLKNSIDMLASEYQMLVEGTKELQIGFVECLKYNERTKEELVKAKLRMRTQKRKFRKTIGNLKSNQTLNKIKMEKKQIWLSQECQRLKRKYEDDYKNSERSRVKKIKLICCKCIQNYAEHL